MRLQQYLTESQQTPEEIIDILHKDCSDYFKYIRYGVKSFRGSVSGPPVWAKKTPRKNREPLNTDKDTHKLLDNAFKKKFGWKVRSEGVFATAHFDQAEDYGDPYYFFPSNGFKMVYSSDINDLYMYTGKKDHIISTYGGMESYIDQRIIPSYKQGGPKDINKALQTFNEVIFKCKFYYLVDTDFVTEFFDMVYER